MATEDKPPRQILVDMAQGFVQGKALCAAVRLGIADALGDDIKHVDELAADTESMRDPLYRLLRALAGIGILKEVSPAHFLLLCPGNRFAGTPPTLFGHR